MVYCPAVEQPPTLNLILLGGHPEDWAFCVAALQDARIAVIPCHTLSADARLRMGGSAACKMILASSEISGWPRSEIIAMLHAAGPPAPWVLVSSAASSEEARECLDGGAWDYVSRDELWRLAIAARRLWENYALRRNLAQVETLWAGVGHDVNNLLSGVIGNADYLIQFLAGDPRARQSLEGILTAGELSAAWVQQCATAGPTTRGSDLVQALDRMECTLQLLAGPKIRLRLTIGKGPIQVAADPAEVARAVLNLVFNARDAMARGGTLTIEAGIARRNELLWGTISVTDTGNGMDQETCRRIFDPLYTSKSRHLGLGLPTVRALVEQSGGFIELKSGLRLGSTFSIYLPLAEANAREVRGPLELGAEAARQDSCREKTILLVEDQPTLREIVARTLKSRRHQVIEAESAQAALELSRERAFDLLLTDVRLPAMNGIELAAALRESNPGVPVIYMSGRRDQALDGNGAFLLKPFKPATLLETVDRALIGAPVTARASTKS